MRISDWSSDGCSSDLRFAVGESSLGTILVASSAKGVVSILLGDDPDALVRDLQDRFPKASLIGADESYEALVAHVVGFVEAPAIGLDPQLAIRGTAFRSEERRGGEEWASTCRQRGDRCP